MYLRILNICGMEINLIEDILIDGKLLLINNLILNLILERILKKFMNGQILVEGLNKGFWITL